MKRDIKIGLISFFIAFFISAIILIFPTSSVNKMMCPTKNMDLSNPQTFNPFTSNETQRNQILQEVDECNNQKIMLFGHQNYIFQLVGLFFICAIFSIPLFFMGKLSTQKKRSLVFLVPLFYLTINIIGFILTHHNDDSLGLGFMPMAFMTASFPFLYLIFYLPLICLAISIFTSIYLFVKSGSNLKETNAY